MFGFCDSNYMKHELNYPDGVAEVELQNGMIVDYDPATRKVTPHAAGNAAYVVYNNIDKPDLPSPDDYVIAPGEHPRVFSLDALVGVKVWASKAALVQELSAINVGDTLGADAQGKLSTSGDTTSAHLKVVAKDGACGGRVIAIVAKGE